MVCLQWRECDASSDLRAKSRTCWKPEMWCGNLGVMVPFLTGLLIAVSPTAQFGQLSAFVSRRFGTSHFRRAEADLNGDGRKEIFVYITDPYYCGSGGCSLVILSPYRHSFRVVMKSTIVKLPIRLLSTSTHGWRDVGVTVQGGGIIGAYEARMRFNGLQYPSNPTLRPAIRLKAPSGKILIGP